MISSRNNKLRIGGGTWRSRLLCFPDVPGLRPTPDRVRQTLFNWLGKELHGLVCLDLFSGTGVLGFEALSRGAASAVIVEKAPQAYQGLLESKHMLGADAAQILNIDAERFLAKNSQPFDIIFLDPPFGQDWLPRLLPQMKQHLAPLGRVYAEVEHALQDDKDWQVIKQGKAGNVRFHLLKSTDEG